MNFMASIQSAWDAFWNPRNRGGFGGTRQTSSHEVVSEDSALNFSAVWCATRLLCGTGASLPLPLFKTGTEDTREKAKSHPLYSLLNVAPNPEMNAFAFRSIMWQHQVNWGNAYAEIVREGDNPLAPVAEIWPIHPERVTIDRYDDGSLVYMVRGDKPGQPARPVDPWRILNVPSLITYDGLLGHGVIAHARESIGAGIAAEKYGANWFGGAGVPRAVIEIPGKTWDEPARQQFRKEWGEIHSGPSGDRIALLQGGAKLTPISMSAEDSQFLETRQFSVEEIARWYGVPPHLLQHLLRATFSNIEHLGISFVQYSLIPWLRIWEQCIASQLLTERERAKYFAEHNVTALLRGDNASRADYYRAMTGAAIMTRNECRKLENLDPVDGGDTFLIQGATVPLDEDGKPVSDFTGMAAGAPAGNMPPEPQDEGDDSESTVVSEVSSRLLRVISHDLSRFLTKETKAIGNFTRKPDIFCTLVDDFYTSQSLLIRDELTETFGALVACGAAVSPDVTVLAWVTEGRDLVLEAAGKATADKLPEVVSSVLASKTWSERPIRAVEGVKHATTGV